MKHTTTLFALMAPMVLGGCAGAYWGNLIVLGISAGIFCGTLSLGRDSTQGRDMNGRGRADASKSAQDGRS